MIKIVCTIFLLLVFCACQTAPTKIKNEIGGPSELDIIYADTRSELDFVGFRIPGSVHLDTEDFLILVDARSKRRILDPDIGQIIERLAKKGISPNKNIILVEATGNSESAKKWKWLLSKLNILKIEIQQFDEIIKNNKPLRPKAEPNRESAWGVSDKSWYKISEKCFVEHQANLCL